MTLSRSAIDKLGKRLAASDDLSQEDAELLGQLLEAHAAALAVAEERLRAIGLATTVRVKTRGTLVDKVRRGTRLSSMDDVAGARIVADVTWSEQDRIVDRISGAFPGGKLVDRRAKPTHGYRAVHYVAPVGDCRVEIQVRTRLQDMWAQTMEAIADRWGRDIRYGSEPVEASRPAGPGQTRRDVVEVLLANADVVAEVESLADARTEVERVIARIVDPGIRAYFTRANRDLLNLQPHLDRLTERLHDAFGKLLGSFRGDVQ